MLKPLSFVASKAKNGGGKKKDPNAKLAAMYDSHQDGERKTLIETRLRFISIVCLWKVLVGLTDEETLLNEEKMKITVVKIEKNNEGHAVKTNYIKIDIT